MVRDIIDEAIRTESRISWSAPAGGPDRQTNEGLPVRRDGASVVVKTDKGIVGLNTILWKEVKILKPQQHEETA